MRRAVMTLICSGILAGSGLHAMNFNTFIGKLLPGQYQGQSWSSLYIDTAGWKVLNKNGRQVDAGEIAVFSMSVGSGGRRYTVDLYNSGNLVERFVISGGFLESDKRSKFIVPK